MSRFSAILIAAAVAVVLQTTLINTLPLGTAAPDLLLILCVFLGLHQQSVGGALAAFFIGYLQDSVSGSPTGLNAFAASLVFLLVYLTSSRLWVDNFISRFMVVFLASMVKSFGVMILVGFFLSVDGLWDTAWRRALMQALSAAAVAPLVFGVLSTSRRMRAADAN